MRRWWLLGLAMFGGILGVPQIAAAADPPFRALGSFDRVAVSFSTPRRVVVTAQQDATSNTSTAVVSAESGPFPRGVAWAPGAASFALIEQGAPDYRLRVIESPDGTSHDLTSNIDVLRTNKMLTRIFNAVRWTGGGIAPRILVDMVSTGNASIKPDGTAPTLVDPHQIASIDVALFADGHRAIVSHLSPVLFGGLHYKELYLQDLVTGAETQLTNNLGHDSRAPALSPDEHRVAYVEDAFQNSSDESRLRVMNIDGTGNDYMPLPGDLFYDQPAWKPDGSRLAFVGLARPESPGGGVGQPTLYSAKPDGTDVARHTDPRPLFNPYPHSNNSHSIRPSDIAWGTTCTVLAACIGSIVIAQPPAGGPAALQANPNLLTGASIGFLVERYHGKHLTRFGRIPFGQKRKGHAKVRWNLRVNGRPLPRGRYRITLRALEGTVPIDRSKPVDLIVGRNHKLRLTKALVR